MAALRLSCLVWGGSGSLLAGCTLASSSLIMRLSLVVWVLAAVRLSVSRLEKAAYSWSCSESWCRALEAELGGSLGFFFLPSILSRTPRRSVWEGCLLLTRVSVSSTSLRWSWLCLWQLLLRSFASMLLMVAWRWSCLAVGVCAAGSGVSISIRI